MPWLYSPADGPLAQLVEQGTLNPKVEGSNPSRPTFHAPAPAPGALSRLGRPVLVDDHCSREEVCEAPSSLGEEDGQKAREEGHNRKHKPHEAHQ
jgi:hypothetical protein